MLWSCSSNATGTVAPCYLLSTQHKHSVLPPSYQTIHELIQQHCPSDCCHHQLPTALLRHPQLMSSCTATCMHHSGQPLSAWALHRHPAQMTRKHHAMLFLQAGSCCLIIDGPNQAWASICFPKDLHMLHTQIPQCWPGISAAQLATGSIRILARTAPTSMALTGHRPVQGRASHANNLHHLQTVHHDLLRSKEDPQHMDLVSNLLSLGLKERPSSSHLLRGAGLQAALSHSSPGVPPTSMPDVIPGLRLLRLPKSSG